MKTDTTASPTRLVTPAEPIDLSIADVAELFDVSIDTVRRWRKYGKGPNGYRIGKYLRFRRSEVEAWAQEHREAS